MAPADFVGKMASVYCDARVRHSTIVFMAMNCFPKMRGARIGMPRYEARPILNPFDFACTLRNRIPKQ